MIKVFKGWKCEMLAGMQSDWNSHTVAVAVQTGTATLEDSTLRS